MIFENDDEQALFEQFKEWRREHGGKQAFSFYSEQHNPFSEDHWNMTAQNEILKRNPHRALELAKGADNRASVRMIEDYIANGGN